MLKFQMLEFDYSIIKLIIKLITRYYGHRLIVSCFVVFMYIPLLICFWGVSVFNHKEIMIQCN